jgi:antitoxin (DNA-binding transcriptional repressor) of toxin-antitoxin stability system
MVTKTMQISEFKAKCIATLKEVKKSRNSVDVTLRGVVVARVVPISRKRKLGSLASLGKIRGDIVNADFGNEWELE